MRRFPSHRNNYFAGPPALVVELTIVQSFKPFLEMPLPKLNEVLDTGPMNLGQISADNVAGI